MIVHFIFNFGCAESLLLWAFLQLKRARTTLQMRLVGFSLRCLLLPSRGSRAHGLLVQAAPGSIAQVQQFWPRCLVALWHVGSSLIIRDKTSISFTEQADSLPLSHLSVSQHLPMTTVDVWYIIQTQQFSTNYFYQTCKVQNTLNNRASKRFRYRSGNFQIKKGERQVRQQ